LVIELDEWLVARWDCLVKNYCQVSPLLAFLHGFMHDIVHGALHGTALPGQLGAADKQEDDQSNIGQQKNEQQPGGSRRWLAVHRDDEEHRKHDEPADNGKCSSQYGKIRIQIYIQTVTSKFAAAPQNFSISIVLACFSKVPNLIRTIDSCYWTGRSLLRVAPRGFRAGLPAVNCVVVPLSANFSDALSI